MEQYVIITKKVFESAKSFQQRINEQAQKGYKAIGIAGQTGSYVLMEKVY